VIGQYANMEHVGIGKYYPGVLSYFSSLRLGGITIKGSQLLFKAQLLCSVKIASITAML
jgi:hypothetical protein